MGAAVDREGIAVHAGRIPVVAKTEVWNSGWACSSLSDNWRLVVASHLVAPL